MKIGQVLRNNSVKMIMRAREEDRLTIKRNTVLFMGN